VCVWDESAAVQPSRQRVDDALEAVPGRWFAQEQGHFAVGQMTSLPVLTAEGNINAGGGPAVTMTGAALPAFHRWRGPRYARLTVAGVRVPW
jgi:hypothetical protein